MSDPYSRTVTKLGDWCSIYLSTLDEEEQYYEYLEFVKVVRKFSNLLAQRTLTKVRNIEKDDLGVIVQLQMPDSPNILYVKFPKICDRSKPWNTHIRVIDPANRRRVETDIHGVYFAVRKLVHIEQMRQSRTAMVA